jgi:hypothetical protein
MRNGGKGRGRIGKTTKDREKVDKRERVRKGDWEVKSEEKRRFKRKKIKRGRYEEKKEGK